MYCDMKCVELQRLKASIKVMLYNSMKKVKIALINADDGMIYKSISQEKMCHGTVAQFPLFSHVRGIKASFHQQVSHELKPYLVYNNYKQASSYIPIIRILDSDWSDGVDEFFSDSSFVYFSLRNPMNVHLHRSSTAVLRWLPHKTHLKMQ